MTSLPRKKVIYLIVLQQCWTTYFDEWGKAKFVSRKLIKKRERCKKNSLLR